jgi:DNA (cytosine-5)-methyltransferase 1
MDFVDLYCGVGGLSLGLTDAGMTPLAAFDHWAPALEIYRRNIGNHAAQADLAQPWHVIPRIKRLRPDLIAGGPPCQDFSAAGNRTEGNRAALTVRFAQIVVSVAPRFFLMENTRLIASKKAYATAANFFRRPGTALPKSCLMQAGVACRSAASDSFALGIWAAKTDSSPRNSSRARRLTA